VKIRQATVQDAAAVTALVIEFRDFLERPAPTDAEISQGVRTLLEADDTQIFLACDGEQTMGYVIQRYRWSMWVAGIEASIEDLFVSAGCRRRGVGKALTDFAIAAAAQRGCKAISLNSNEFNDAANKIYTRRGFSAESKRWQGRQIFSRKWLTR